MLPFFIKIKNKKEKERVISIISNTKNCILSYKDKSSFNEYLKSSLIDELNKLGEWMKWFLLTVITLIIISQVSHMFLTYGG